MEAHNNMPRDIFTRIVKGDMNNPNIRQAMEWLQRIAQVSHLDPEVLLYPSTRLLQAYEKGTAKPLLYMPVHQVFMMESLGPNPDASPMEIAAALAQITKTVCWEAQNQGIGEFYMPCSDGNVIKMAEAHGFMRMTYDETHRRELSEAERKEVETPEGGEAPREVVETIVRDMPFLKMKAYR
jgi:hypothetical protein